MLEVKAEKKEMLSEEPNLFHGDLITVDLFKISAEAIEYYINQYHPFTLYMLKILIIFMDLSSKCWVTFNSRNKLIRVEDAEFKSVHSL